MLWAALPGVKSSERLGAFAWTSGGRGDAPRAAACGGFSGAGTDFSGGVLSKNLLLTY